MANAVKTNRSHLIANDNTIFLTRQHIGKIDKILQEMAEGLDTTSESLQTRLEVIEEVTTDNIANMTTAVNNQLRTV
jgi:hypothetical protein